ncbi:DUF1963 domain-containing protein [Tropicimonas sediminicola]|uniref:DUF1963 domain-containing protein n=1 Tax=Tropicimonas sediminicola TaxID=1031541 RepID=A0A239IMM6_9RHOB|nr:DUF1963 domain-containing protein [Tropicimonas sediminicola]SNS94642.1 protein of unknown function [Tropicimonas sediminicola]
MFKWLRKGKRPERRASIDVDQILAELEARTGSADRASELPAWALILRSPFRPWQNATSWLGGTPRAPLEFVWPLGTDGAPLHFLAQIDLGALQPWPETGSLPPGLPDGGAMLVFVGLHDYAVRIIDAKRMRVASGIPVPPTLPPVSEIGYFSEEPTFGRWPVDPVAFLDHGKERPADFPERFADPAAWIDTWAVAEIDARLLVQAMRREIGFAEQFFNSKAHWPDPPTRVILDKQAFYGALLQEAPTLLPKLEAWQARAAAEPQAGAVDATALRAMLAERLAFAEGKPNYPVLPLLRGSAHAVWGEVRRQYRDAFAAEAFQSIPEGLRTFIDARITDWRRHRLFGLEPEFPNNSEDRRGQDVLISIHADELLNTMSEHDYGMSIWCDRAALDQGRHEEGQLIRHCAV